MPQRRRGTELQALTAIAAQVNCTQDLDEILDGDAARNESVLTLQLPPQTVTPEEYPEFARFCQAVDELMSRPLTVRRVGE